MDSFTLMGGLAHRKTFNLKGQDFQSGFTYMTCFTTASRVSFTLGLILECLSMNQLEWRFLLIFWLNLVWTWTKKG